MLEEEEKKSNNTCEFDRNLVRRRKKCTGNGIKNRSLYISIINKNIAQRKFIYK